MQVKWAINIQLTFYNKGKELKVSTNQYSLNIEYKKRKIIIMQVGFFLKLTCFQSILFIIKYFILNKSKTLYYFFEFLYLGCLFSHPCWFSSCILRVSKCRMKYVVAFQSFICIDKLGSKLRNYSCPIKKIQNKTNHA